MMAMFIYPNDAEAADQFKESLKELDDYTHFQPNYRYKTFSTQTWNCHIFTETEMDLMELNLMMVQILGLVHRNWGSVAVLDTGIYPEHQDFCGDNGTFNESAQIRCFNM